MQALCLLSFASIVSSALLPDGESDNVPHYDVDWNAQPTLPRFGMPDIVHDSDRLPQMVVGQRMPEATHDKARAWDAARSKQTSAQLMQRSSTSAAAAAAAAAAAPPTHEKLPCPLGADGTASCVKSFGSPDGAAEGDTPPALPDISVLGGRHPARFVFENPTGVSGPDSVDPPEPTDFGNAQGEREMNHAVTDKVDRVLYKQRPANEVLCDLGGCPSDGQGMVEKAGPSALRRAVAMAAVDALPSGAAPMPDRPGEEQPTGRQRPAMPEASDTDDAAGEARVVLGTSRRAMLRRLSVTLEQEAAREGIRSTPATQAAVQSAVARAVAATERGSDLTPLLDDARRLAQAQLRRWRLDTLSKVDDEGFRDISREDEQRMLARMPDVVGRAADPAPRVVAANPYAREEGEV